MSATIDALVHGAFARAAHWAPSRALERLDLSGP